MIPRTLSKRCRELAASFSVVYLTGPRQSGKTTLARNVFPEFLYISLEDLQNREEAFEDPRGFLLRLENKGGVILDEVQRTPDLFSYLQGFVDEKRGGPLILTGSQHFLLSEKISQSLAGRAAILELLPFSLAELRERKPLTPNTFLAPVVDSETETSGTDLFETLFKGFFPPIHDRNLDASTWLDGYLRTYVERDVRQIANVGNLDTFTRFVGLCAGRVGSLLNASSLGADAGVTHATARRWLSIMRAGYILYVLMPHHQNFAKRLIKSPKLYFADTGLLCHILGIRRYEDIHLHPLRGAIFENFVVNEIQKLFIHNGQRPPLYFWRDSKGLEVDLIMDMGTRRIPVEIKSGATVAADFLTGLDRYVQLSGDPEGVLVYGGEESYLRRNHHVRAWWTCS
jgi:predicted AAA+ superfamily ATPase